MSDPATDTHDVRRFFGLALMGLGVLAMVAAGLCSGGFVIAGLFNNVSLDDAVGMMPMIVLFGGAGVGVGIALYSFGRILRPRR